MRDLLPITGASLDKLVEELRLWRLDINENFRDLWRTGLPESNVAPTKLRNGMLAFADGTNWNPGSGRGVYCYDSVTAAWRFLG